MVIQLTAGQVQDSPQMMLESTLYLRAGQTAQLMRPVTRLMSNGRQVLAGI